MNKKRLMLACAIGALVLLAGSGVARCAMQPSEDPATGQEKELSLIHIPSPRDS